MKWLVYVVKHFSQDGNRCEATQAPNGLSGLTKLCFLLSIVWGHNCLCVLSSWVGLWTGYVGLVSMGGYDLLCVLCHGGYGLAVCLCHGGYDWLCVCSHGGYDCCVFGVMVGMTAVCLCHGGYD